MFHPAGVGAAEWQIRGGRWREQQHGRVRECIEQDEITYGLDTGMVPVPVRNKTPCCIPSGVASSLPPEWVPYLSNPIIPALCLAAFSTERDRHVVMYAFNSLRPTPSKRYKRYKHEG
jgi:hypothetical protein